MKYLLLVVKILLRSLHVYMLLTMGYAHTVMLHGIRESTPSDSCAFSCMQKTVQPLAEGAELWGFRLSTQTERLDDGTVAVDVALVEIVKQCAALTYQLCQGTGRNMVLVVFLEVLCHVGDTVGEQCNLALGRTGVACRLGVAELLEKFLLLS